MAGNHLAGQSPRRDFFTAALRIISGIMGYAELSSEPNHTITSGLPTIRSQS